MTLRREKSSHIFKEKGKQSNVKGRRQAIKHFHQFRSISTSGNIKNTLVLPVFSLPDSNSTAITCCCCCCFLQLIQSQSLLSEGNVEARIRIVSWTPRGRVLCALIDSGQATIPQANSSGYLAR